jgi:integrase
MAKSKRKRTPKSVLKLPDLEQSRSAVLNSLTSPSSQRTYDHAIREFIEWYCSEPRLAFNKTVVTRYRISLEQRHYASTTINLRLAAVRRLAYEAADCGLLSADLAAGIRRVKGAKRLGLPVGNWLTAEQGKRLLSTADNLSLRGKRDYATLAILLGCGLRRAELTALRVEDIQQREEHWVIAGREGIDQRIKAPKHFRQRSARPEKTSAGVCPHRSVDPQSCPRNELLPPRCRPSGVLSKSSQARSRHLSRRWKGSIDCPLTCMDYGPGGSWTRTT